MTTPFTTGRLAWTLGIEDTCVYPPDRYGMFTLDEHALTDHDDRWRDDIRAARDLGATAIRYGASWPLAHPAPGRFDWAMLDERLGFATELGLDVIADLVHYGTPRWLEQAFADDGYVDAVAAFAGAFAEHFRGAVDHITPLNEPLTTASFSGLRGVWPPALTGWDGWTTVTLNIAEGIAEASAAVKASNPDAVIVHVEAASLYTAGSAEHDGEAAQLSRVGFLPTDLAVGRVDDTHPLHAWLVRHGASPARLDALRARPAGIDIMGVNYYPDLSPRRITAHPDSHEGSAGESIQLAHNLWTDGLETSIRAFSTRYGLPIMITETSIEGDDELRRSWLHDSANAVRELISGGVDIRAFTWWPFFDFVDWSYASGGANIEEFEIPADVLAARLAAHDGPRPVPREPFLRRMGLMGLDERDGALVLRRTAAADEFAKIAAATARTGSTSTETEAVDV
ncbi:family 1 glycosylhydrolase [Gryllotalpicola reticulitermitis]|uniref:Family 1 glycosylhydrolase n=1 Tax=Gryllotalpicola reticulitermitis TaxID=1184153 RepID=A0ABV8Q4F7_9MICO